MSERKINVRVRISEAEIRKSLFIDINSPRMKKNKIMQKASNIVDIIAGLDNISTANNMFPMYIQAYSPYYQMYIRFICRQPLVVDIFLFVLLLLGALICQCYIIHLSRAVTSKCFDLKLLLFYPFFDFCMILFFYFILDD